MRSIILAALALQWIVAFHSNAATWENCEGVTPAAEYTIPQLKQFKDGLRDEFTRLFGLAKKSNQVNRFCLQKVCRVGDPPAAEMMAQCPDSEKYFKEVLPVELRRYRLNMALSNWNFHFQNGSLDDHPFNYELTRGLHSFWQTGGKPVALTPDELAEAQAIWKDKSRIIVNKVLRDMDRELAMIKESVGETDRIYINEKHTADSARQILETHNWAWIYHQQLGNGWLYRTVKEVENVFFKLNKKFLINQMLIHPVLPLMDAATADRNSVVVALDRMEKNLADEEASVMHGFDIMGKYRPFMADDVYPKIDYYSVVGSLLNQNAAFCPIAERLWTDYERKQLIESIGLLVITGGLFILAPPLIGVAGGVALGAIFIYEDMSKLSTMSRGTFMSMQNNLNIRSADEDYLQAEQLTTTVLLSPLMAASVPAFKMSRVLKLLK